MARIFSPATDPFYSNLNGLLNSFGKTTDKSNKNIINHKELKGAYHIKKANIDEFFRIYEIARLKTSVHLMIQENPRSMKYTGCLFDFDIYCDNPLPPKNVKMLAKIICKYMDTDLNMDNIDFPVYITVKKEDDVSNRRRGLHIVIPTIKVSRGYKKVLYAKLLKDKSILKIFKDCSNPIEEIIDQNLVHNNVFLYGSSKKDSNIYPLCYHFSYTNDVSEELEEKPIPENNLPLSRMMSLLYCEGPIFKTPYDDDICEEVKGPIDDEINTKIFKLNAIFPDIDYLVDLIDNISLEVFRNTASWKTFIKAIASIDIRYKPLAIYGSLKCREEFDKPKTKAIIDDVFSESKEEQWGFGKLINWVKEENPDKLTLIQSKNLHNLAMDYVWKCKGRFTDDKYCNILKRYHGLSYVTTYDKKRKDTVTWYRMETTGAHAFKWNPTPTGKFPAALMREIGPIFESVLGKCVVSLKQKMDFEEDKDGKKALKALINNVENSQLACENEPKKRTIMANMVYEIMDEGFYDELDKHPYARGVHGGILLLPSKSGELPKFIQNDNSYKVSLSCKRKWKPYDENDPDIKEVYKVLKEAFYLSKKRAVEAKAKGLPTDYDSESFDFIMFHYCRGLIRQQQTPLLLNLHGIGANAKSLLEALIQNTMGADLTCGIKAEFLTEPATSPESPNPTAVMMMNKDYVSFTETEKDRVMNESKLKWLLSPGENKTIRDLFGTCFQTKFTNILTTYSNYLMTIEGTDNGVWRRQLFLELKRVYKDDNDFEEANPKHRRNNPYYINKWVTEDRIKDAYFRILVHYWTRLLNEYDGNIASVPHTYIAKCTRKIRLKFDHIERYIQTQLIVDEDGTIKLDDLVENYMTWYKKNIGMIVLHAISVANKFNKSSSLNITDNIVRGYRLKI